MATSATHMSTSARDGRRVGNAPTTEFRLLEEMLAPADVRLGGERPWDIKVHDPRMARRILALGALGAGESYMDGDWDCLRNLIRSD